MLFITGVVNEDPVPNKFPPFAALYQLTDKPAPAVALRFKVPVPQRVSPCTFGVGMTVASTATGLDVPTPPLTAQVTAAR